MRSISPLSTKTVFLSVVDPEFPPDGVVNPPGGREHTILPILPKTT